MVTTRFKQIENDRPAGEEDREHDSGGIDRSSCNDVPGGRCVAMGGYGSMGSMELVDDSSKISRKRRRSILGLQE